MSFVCLEARIKESQSALNIWRSTVLRRRERNSPICERVEVALLLLLLLRFPFFVFSSPERDRVPALALALVLVGDPEGGESVATSVFGEGKEGAMERLAECEGESLAKMVLGLVMLDLTQGTAAEAETEAETERSEGGRESGTGLRGDILGEMTRGDFERAKMEGEAS